MAYYYCYPLSRVGDAAEFGGKAGNLARVARLGYRVPRTVVVNRDALRRFISTNELRESIEACFAKGERTQTTAAFKSVVAAVHRAVIPEELRAEIREVAERLLRESPYGLAIRSSAVFEDSERASFAGVFESFLGIVSPDEALEKVISCWCATWSPRAVRYMHRMGIEPIIDGMAVMVQEVVPAVSSGVIYTADPKSGNPWHFVMQATRGLSIDLMSGSGVGDLFRVDWESGAILERDIVSKPAAIRATHEGVRQVADKLTEPALRDEDAAEISRIARELDDEFNSRLDVEWAVTLDGMWILQARPMTALPTFFPVSLTTEQAKRSWKPILATLPLRPDQLPHFLTPLYSHYSESEMWHRYQPDDIILTSLCKHELDVNGYRYCESGDQPNFQDFFQGPGEYEAWLETNEQRYRQRWDNRMAELCDLRDDAMQGIDETRSAAELIPVLLDVMDRLWDLNSFGWSGPQALGWMCQAALNHFLQERNVQADTASLLGGGTDSYTFQVTKSQRDLGRSIREPKVVEAFEGLPLGEIVPHLMKTAQDSEFIAQLESFCWRFGKTPPSWLGRPTFWSASAIDIQIVSTIKNAWLGKSRDVQELQAESLKQRQQQEQVIRAALTKADSSACQRFSCLLEWARYWGQALNDRHGLAAGLLHERELVWQVAARLQSEGLLWRADDVLVFKRPDLERIARTADPRASRETYLERLREYRRHRRLTPPPVVGAAHQEKELEVPLSRQMNEVESGDDVLRGRGFGGGIATGRARKVINLLDATVLESFGEDDVLVLPHETAFHYADWHSLLTVIKAVVSPGRPSHHLAQVARECGVPLVGHVMGDLDAIPEGATIRVDGLSGLVHTE